MRTSIAVCFVSLLTLSACGGKDGSTSPSASSSAAAAGGVVVDASGISVGGKKVGDAPADKLQPLDGLLDALAKMPRGMKPAASMDEGPSQIPLAVSLPADTSCLGAMNVLFVAERAGFRRVALTVGAKNQTIDLAQTDSDPVAKGDVLTLSFRADGKVAVGKAPCAGAFDAQPASAIEASAKELTTGASIKGGPVLVACEAGAKFADVVDVYTKTRPSPSSPLSGMRCDGRTRVPFFAFKDPNAPAAPDVPWGREETVGPPVFKLGDPSILDENSVRMGGASVSGPISPDDVKAAVEKRMTDIERCYAGAVATNSVLAGSVTFGLEIGKSGEVMAASNAGSSLPDNAVVACVIHQAAQATFPAAAGVTRVTYPVSFAPPEKKKK